MHVNRYHRLKPSLDYLDPGYSTNGNLTISSNNDVTSLKWVWLSETSSNPECIVHVENMCNNSIVNNLLLCVKTVEVSIDRSTDKKMFGWHEELDQLKKAVNSDT